MDEWKEAVGDSSLVYSGIGGCANRQQPVRERSSQYRFKSIGQADVLRRAEPRCSRGRSPDRASAFRNRQDQNNKMAIRQRSRATIHCQGERKWWKWGTGIGPPFSIATGQPSCETFLSGILKATVGVPRVCLWQGRW
jgi:hypothetical protein